MASRNQGFDAGDDSAADDKTTSQRTNQSSTSGYVPDENSQLARSGGQAAHQTYFADEKVQIPDIDKVSRANCCNSF